MNLLDDSKYFKSLMARLPGRTDLMEIALPDTERKAKLQVRQFCVTDLGVKVIISLLINWEIEEGEDEDDYCVGDFLEYARDTVDLWSGITVNCIHPGTTRTERTPGMLAARAAQLGISAEELEQQDFAPDSPRGNAICRMVDAAEVAYLTTYLASDKAWAITGEVIAAGGGTGSAVYY